jgi:hypothetical protein
MCAAVRWRRLKKPAQAIECLVQAIELTRQAPDLSRETGSMLNYLADLYLQEGQLAQAEPVSFDTKHEGIFSGYRVCSLKENVEPSGGAGSAKSTSV